MCFLKNLSTDNWVSILAILIALGSLAWTIRENNITSDKLKLFDRPKIGLSSEKGIELIPYATKTKEEFLRKNWGTEKPLIFSTRNKGIFDLGKYDRLSLIENGKLRLQGQINLENKGILEMKKLHGKVIPYFNGAEIEEKKDFNCINTILPNETFNIRFVALLPVENLKDNESNFLLNLVLEYDGPTKKHYGPEPFWYSYDHKVNNWNHCSEKDIEFIDINE